MKPKILDNQKAQQATVNNGYTQFAACAASMNTALAAVTSNQQLAALSDAHLQCRQQQSTAVAATQSCTTQLTAAQTVASQVCQDLAALDGQLSALSCSAASSQDTYESAASRCMNFYQQQFTNYETKKKARPPQRLH